MVPSERTRGDGHNLKYRKFHLNMKDIFTVTVVNPGANRPEELWRSFGWYPKPKRTVLSTPP